MIDIGMGDWIKDYNGYLLMKFTSKYRYQQHFLDGKLFFNTSDFFARCDDVGRSDHHEGNAIVVNESEKSTSSLRYEIINGQVCLIEEDYTNNMSEYRKSNVFSYSPAENRRRKIMSFYTMYINFDNEQVSTFADNMSKEFGEYGIIILDRQEFFDRIEKALKKQNEIKKAQLGFVEYHDIKPGVNHWHPFKKDKNKFKYQNEFRITFINDNDKCFTLDLEKSLRDIAVPIQAKDINEIYFKDGNLMYPVYKKFLLKRSIYKMTEPFVK